MIIAGLAESKKDHPIKLFAKLEVGMDELQTIAGDRKREVVAPKQKELLQYVVLNYANVDIHDPDVRDHEPISHYLAKQLTKSLNGVLDSCGSIRISFFRRTPYEIHGEDVACFWARTKHQLRNLLQQLLNRQGILYMGSRDLDVRRLPVMVGCWVEEDSKQAFVLKEFKINAEIDFQQDYYEGCVIDVRMRSVWRTLRRG
ncbi:hypothetical protein Tco_0693622 [Tanacetum coccineum]